ncbi:hypothetical protein R5W24_001256 [Gemmata sp. JC717]|uniref:hypothetical protein n=1 Tax=Gemmata algarum TaxID=2975278 RepID=UPI0021BBB227|nr:hypothetical protein [Gemmata algarum]MDY3552176.1 hypothetical protein [Gemmata algarum]
MTRFRYCRELGAGVVALGMLAPPSAAQPTPPPGPLESKLAEQKAKANERDVERNLAEAFKIADAQLRLGQRSKATETLKKAKQDIPLVGITEATRTYLTNRVDAKLDELEGRRSAVANPATGVKLDPKSPEVIAAQKAALEKAALEHKDVVEGLKSIQRANESKDTAVASAEIARLTKLYPTNPSVQALGYTGSIATRLEEAIAIQVQMRARWVKSQQDLTRSAMPAIMDVEYPSNWREISARRLKPVEMTAKEKKILEALDKPVSVNFRDRPFEEALQDLSNMLDQPLLLDKQSLQDLETNLKSGATLEAKGLAGRTVLRSILAAQGLTFVVKDETIQIVTVERARNLLTTRVYYIGDLTLGKGPFSGPEWGPALNADQAALNALNITSMITKSIDPLSWRDNGSGPGTVTYHAPSAAIIVRASAEVHFSLSRTFGPGR